MESEAEIAFPLQAIWVGPSTKTLERTQVFTKAHFQFRFSDNVLSLTFQEIALFQPGCPIILESPSEKDFDGMIQAFDANVRKFVEFADSPVILCVGRRLPAEIVVDWMRAGVFSYVEEHADELHFQQAFQAVALQSAKIREQYVRYTKLSKLWGAISDREGSVLDMLMEGLPNKTIANRLGVSQRTIEARRHNLYEKLESRSVVEVVRLIYELNSLEQIFRRIDTNSDSQSGRGLKRPKFLRPLPLLHCRSAELPFFETGIMSPNAPES